MTTISSKIDTHKLMDTFAGLEFWVEKDKEDPKVFAYDPETDTVIKENMTVMQAVSFGLDRWSQI